MEKYEKQIGLKTIWLTLVRRWPYVLIIFLPILLASLIVTQGIMKKTYASTATISKFYAAAPYFDAGSWDKFKIYIDNSLATTETALAEQGVKHVDGSLITVADMATVSLAAFKSNQSTLTITFTSSDKTITKPVLTELTTQAYAKCFNPDGSAQSGFEGTKFEGGSASNPSISSGNTKYFIIGAAAGLVLALALPFVYEIASDEVYDAADISSWGVPAFDMKASTPKEKRKHLTVEI